MEFEIIEKRFFPRIKECYLHGVWGFLNEQALDYSYAIEFEKKINTLNLEALGFKPTKAELWSGDAQKRVVFNFNLVDDTKSSYIKTLTLFVSAVAPAMLMTVSIQENDHLLLHQEELKIYDENDTDMEPWNMIAKALITIAKEMRMELCTVEECRKYTVPFITDYDWYGISMGNEDEDGDELEFLDKDPEALLPEEISVAKSYAPLPVDIIDCLFGQDYYFI